MSCSRYTGVAVAFGHEQGQTWAGVGVAVAPGRGVGVGVKVLVAVGVTPGVIVTCGGKVA
ncbi:MAG: hypothetical protein V9H69_05640 [Anaerolineae bacterium]